MERGRDCVERNRSERAKIANVAEWKPPASTEAQYSGLSVPSMRCFSVQYHPEASPGPHDSRYLFTRFHRYLCGEEEM